MNQKVKVLIDRERIERRVRELGEEISRHFSGKVVVISLLKGAFVFTADLVRNLKLDAEVDFMRLKSYTGREKGELRLTYRPETDLKGKDVLIVDDIFDTGESLEFAYREVLSAGAKRVKTCVLLDKEVEKRTQLRPDFVGFKIPDYFVFGYGLDLNETFRGLPYIAYFEGAKNG